MKHLLWLPLIAFVGVVAAFAQTRPAADLIVQNARIWTVDRSLPEAQAVAILGDRIVSVGTEEQVDAWRGPNTRVIDAAGHLLLPGFNDAHVHFTDGGFQLDSVELNDATSPQEFARRIAERAAKMSQGEWLLGGDWDETKWNSAELPTKQLIDAATPETPVAVGRYDGHMILANSLALKIAGITAQTQDPDGGVVVRDRQGNPTGALKDAAMDLLFKAVPPPSHDQRRHAIERALAHAASLGVTSVQHMNPDYPDIAIYSELLDEGKLTTRIYAAPLITQVDDQVKIGIKRGFGGPYLRIGAVKAYADGSLGSATAYFFEPFSDQPGNRGLLSDEMHPISLMRDRMMAADAAGLQLCTHAIGDAAISAILDIYTEIEKTHGRNNDRRWRIEHAQHMATKDFDRFALLHVIASVQPYHAIDDGRWAERRIGRDRASRTYAFRTFLDHGVRLALGTDWNVAPLDPMLTLYAATTRATLDGKNPNGWFPEQKLTIKEAIEAYTMGSAYAEFQEDEKGSITVGKLADIVLLSDDVLTIAPARIRDVKILKTWVGGKLTFDADAAKQTFVYPPCDPTVSAVIFGNAGDDAASARLAALFEQDEARERNAPNENAADPGQSSREYWKRIFTEDHQRQVEVMHYLQAGVVNSAEDLYHAAMIFQHGNCPEHFKLANLLAKMAIENGSDRARWLYAATLDRYLMSEGRPQQFGTQFVTIGKTGTWELYDFDPATTDEERARYNVPPLAVQKQKLEKMNRPEHAGR